GIGAQLFNKAPIAWHAAVGSDNRIVRTLFRTAAGEPDFHGHGVFSCEWHEGVGWVEPALHGCYDWCFSWCLITSRMMNARKLLANSGSRSARVARSVSRAICASSRIGSE